LFSLCSLFIRRYRKIMKASIFNGSLKGDTVMNLVEEIAANNLAARGWHVERFVLRNMAIAPCSGCFGCWFRQPGACIKNDAGCEVTKAFVQSDMAVLLTPVTFGGYSSQLKKAVDRLLPAISPLFMKINGETHHRPRYAKYPGIAVFGALEQHDAGSEEIFATLVERNSINVHSPRHIFSVVLEGATTDQIADKVANVLNYMEVKNE
jgi:multimeric flavodoxin WrbA